MAADSTTVGSPEERSPANLACGDGVDFTGAADPEDSEARRTATPGARASPPFHFYTCRTLTLSAGSRLGPYEIVAPLGAGGMGEVYRARDPRMGRDVAVKVLPPEFARDPDRLRRFEQEARAAGKLHHPNLLTVFDVGTDDGPYIVSELLEGETLRAKIADGRVPLRKAVEYARQMAAGLAAAHEKGIVHRDLKPENVFITRDGQVKILDFGLAKLFSTRDEPAASAVTAAATAERGTDPGTVLGTVGYMSPEQVRAQHVDHRSDIFSLGAILYEMLTGRRAFRGESNADTMSAILREDPPEITTSNTTVPLALERIVRHCLEKDAEQRFQSARDLAFDLESLSGSTSQTSAPAARRRLPRAVLPLLALLAGVAIGALAMRGISDPPQSRPVLRLLTYSGRDSAPAISPDGRTMAFASARDGSLRIWLKDLASGGEVALTDGADTWPRFSPDGTSILFVRKDGNTWSLWRTAILGGTPRRIRSDVTSAEWSGDGRTIVFTGNSGSEAAQSTTLATIAADGSGERVLRKLPRRYVAPRYSPDGQWIALTEITTGNTSGSILLVSTDGKSERSVPLHPYNNPGVSITSWTRDGRLLFAASQSQTIFTNLDSTVFATDRQIRNPEPLLQMLSSIGSVEVAGTNRIVFETVSLSQNLREIASSGETAGGRWLTRGNGICRQPAYSPDGSRIVFSSNQTGNLDIWTVSTSDGALRRITDDAADDFDPAFTPDGRHLIWSSNRRGHFEIWMADTDGSGARQITNDGYDAENATATPDGWLVYNSYHPEKAGVWKVRMDGSSATQVVSGATELPEVSPDGQYVSYHRIAPQSELLVARLSDGKVFKVADVRGQVVQVGSGRSRWTADGQSIAWTDIDENNLWGVLIQKFTPGVDTSATRRPLAGFDPDQHVESFSFSPDGTKLAISVLEQIGAIYMAEGLNGIERPAPAAR